MGTGVAFVGVTLTALIFECLFQCPAVSASAEKDRLARDLTRSYLTAVGPDQTVLKFGLSVICSRYDRATSVLVTNAWEKMIWTDDRLRWEPEEYNGIQSIRLPSKLVWTPDVKLYNSLTPIQERDMTNVVVSHDGSVIWVPTTIYHTLCSEEEDGSGLGCQFRIGSWTYDADTLQLELDGESVDASEYQNSTCPLAFETANAAIRTKHYPCCPEPYSHAEFNIRFKSRK